METVPSSKRLILEDPKEGETEQEAYRRRLMNSFKTGANIETQKLEEEQEARRRKALQKVEQGESGGELYFEGQLVEDGVLERQKYRKEAVQSPTGVPGERTRGLKPLRPEQSASNLEYDQELQKWYRMVKGQRKYE